MRPTSSHFAATVMPAATAPAAASTGPVTRIATRRSVASQILTST
ncbi:hypothetical protein [Nocardioides sp. NPDC000441]